MRFFSVAAVAAAMITIAAASPRTTLTFDYGWRFSLGDPAGVTPALTTASLDPTFTESVDNQTCSQLAYTALGRMGPDDCRGACSATPGCLVWQYIPSDTPHSIRPVGFSARACYIHDGTLGNNPQCTPTGSDAVGGRRAAVPPPLQNRTGVTWAEAGFDDSSWARVDLPHDFVLLGDYSEDADGHHGYLPRNLSGWYRKKFSLPARYAPAAGSGFTWLHFEGVFQAGE